MKFGKKIRSTIHDSKEGSKYAPKPIDQCKAPLPPTDCECEDGKSAYEIAVGLGFIGTEAEWELSLHGKDGKSAYELYVETTADSPVLTLEEWLDGREKDTLESVMNRGNFAPKEIKFKDKDGDSHYFGYDALSYSMYFGNYRPSTVAKGSDNMFFGFGSGSVLTTGTTNAAFGNATLWRLTTGSNNVAVGSQSGRDLTTGSRNVAVGSLAGYIAKTSSENVTIGHASGGRQYEDQTGGQNVTVGASSAAYLASGFGNISIGYRSANALRSGSKNVIIGYQTGDLTNGVLPPAATWDIGNNNVFIGTLAGAAGQVGNKNHYDLIIHSDNGVDRNNPLIQGNFASRFLKISGVFSINPSYMPKADDDFTKAIVAKPDGSFGWENKPTPVDISVKADVTAGNISAPNIILWRTALDVYKKSEVNAKFINGTSEALTELSSVELVGNVLYVKYKGENGTIQSKSVDLSGITTVDVHISDANYNAATNVITLTDTTGATFTVDLSEFSIVTTTDGSGVTTLKQEAVTKLTVSKVGQTGQYADLLGKPAAFVETDTFTSVVIRGGFNLTPALIPAADATFTKNIVAKADGTFGWEDKVEVPTPDLETVVQAGNGTTKNIVFEPDEGIAGQLGFNKNTYSYYFGNMNPDHTGVYNHSFGYDSLSKITIGEGNSAFGSCALTEVTTGIYNSAIGFEALKSITTGKWNSALGSYTFNKITTGQENVGVGYSAGLNLIKGSKNTFLGSTSAENLTSGIYNTMVGYSSNSVYKKGQTTIGDRNTFIGAHSGQGVNGNNNVLIGVLAGRDGNASGLGTLNNKLVIHSHTEFVGTGGDSEGPTVSLESNLKNGLISGDFAERWVKFNGKFIVNPSYLISDNTFTKQIVAKPDGTFGWEDRVVVPKPPATGTFVLKSVNGVMSWVAE